MFTPMDRSMSKLWSRIQMTIFTSCKKKSEQLSHHCCCCALGGVWNTVMSISVCLLT